MKKLICMLLCVVLVTLVSLPVNSLAAETDAIDAFLKTMADYLEVAEAKVAVYKWALSYAEKYADNPTWATVMGARAACWAAQIELAKLPLCEYGITSEQALDLTLADIEEEVLKEAVNNEFSDRVRYSEALGTLESFLWDPFTEYGRTDAIEYIILAVRQDKTETIEYLVANGGLYNSDDPRVTKAVAELPSKYPVLWASWPDWATDEDTLLKNVEASTVAYDQVYAEKSELYGKMTNELERRKKALMAGEVASDTGMSLPMDNYTVIYDLTKFAPGATYTSNYSVCDPVTLDMNRLAPLSDIDPATLYERRNYTDVSKDELNAYVKYLCEDMELPQLSNSGYDEDGVYHSYNVVGNKDIIIVTRKKDGDVWVNLPIGMVFVAPTWWSEPQK